MPSTTTIKRIEKQVRRNLLFDTHSEAYRWSPQVVITFIYDAIEEIVLTMNPWSGFDQDTGKRLNPYNVPDAKALLDIEDEFELIGEVDRVRGLVIPIDDRFEQAIIHIVGSKCFEIDDSDTANAEKAAILYAKAREYAQT